MMRRSLLLLAFLFATSVSALQATDHYIYASATGTGTGANCTNAYTDFGTGTHQINPASMVRGDTYWVLAGNYGTATTGITFSTADSGTSVITIESATAANHGAATDCAGDYGQAVFTGGSTIPNNWAGIDIATDYWTFNGQAVSGCSYPSNNTSCYNMKFWNQGNGGSSGNGWDFYIGGNSNLNFEYIEVEGTGQGFPNNTSTADKCQTDGCGIWGDLGIFANSATSNLYFGYGYWHNTGNGQFGINNGVANNVTVEYNWVSYNHTGQNGGHDQAMEMTASNLIIRYNVFQDICGSGWITDASNAAPTMSNWYVYGNLFFDDSAYLALAPGANNDEGTTYYELVLCAQGILVLGDGNGSTENLSGNWVFADNTIANLSPADVANWPTWSTLPISGGSDLAGTPTIIIENNLYYNTAWVYGNFDSICEYFSCTADYNASFQGTTSSSADWQTLATPAAHDYNVSGTTNPFSGSQPATTIAGFGLVTPDPFASHQGVALSSSLPSGCTASVNCLNSLGLTADVQGANGTIDRGAEQLGSSAAPSPPTNLTATPH